jgi:pyroglutamyl-peptidase
MTATILITGFGPFPGASFNPTGPLVTALARRRGPAWGNIRRVAHVFQTSYAAVDRELPTLLAREQPDALIMFGLASRRRHISIETRARNALTGVAADASGHLPPARMIAPGAGAALSLHGPALRLVTAVRAAGMLAALSGDAGSYLCNYICWRAAEAAERDGIPRRVAFVHVPNVHATNVHVPSAHRHYRPRSRPAITLDDLVRAGEAIMGATLAAAAPTRRPMRR